jgi:hypothetical protein
MLGTFKFELTLSDTSKVTQLVPMYGRPKTHSEIMAANSTGVFSRRLTPFLAYLALWRSGEFKTIH